jgi:alpha,alpha-trehalose phosphorylase
VIKHPAFVVEPWALHETELQLDKLAQTESIFALGNGHIGLRGNLDEGEPAGLPGTYLGGFHEVRPLPYAEAGYGNPEAGQTVINVTNGKLIRLLVEDEPLDIRYGEVRSHERVLDLRAGVLHRTLEWASPTGRPIRISSTRFVSFAQRAVVAIRYEVEALDGVTPVVVQSELVANEQLPVTESDPRAAAALASPLQSVYFGGRDTHLLLEHSTRTSGLTMAAATDHIIDGPPHVEVSAESFEDIGRLLVTADLAPGKPLRLVKFLAYGWSAERSAPAIRDQVAAALAEARHRGWDGLLAEQREYLDDFWERADVEIDGDAELQLAVRFSLFHALQAGARAERRAIAAKGLTGPGYDGHAFWDTETFVLPLLTYTVPHAARDALRWRRATLELAQERARALGLKGAAFAWRTIRGQECSGYWPAGTGAFHVNADIADAVLRYQAASGDEEFAGAEGLELLVETARLWRSLGHHDDAGSFRIDGGDRARRVQRNRRRQRVHESDGRAEPARGLRRDPTPPATGRRARRRRRGGSELARRRPGDADSLRRAAGSPRAGPDVHGPRDMGLRCDDIRAVPAVPALPVLRLVSQAGRQAGRSRARAAPAR